jgi:MFS family permease
MVSTLPSLVVVPATIISGAVAGSKIKYRTLLIIASMLFAIGGTAPYILNDFNMVLVSRIIFGIGVGIVSPLGNALVMRLFDGEQRANMMGMGSVVLNGAGIFFMIISGYICSINVNYTWLLHLTALVPLIIFALFLPEPEKTKQVDGENIKMPAGVYLISIAFGLVFMLFNPLLLNMSTILISEKIGNSATTGTILSMYTVGGMIGGALFSKVFKMTGKYIIPMSLVLLVVGLGVCNYSYNILMMMVGCIIAGASLFVILPAVMMEVGQMVPKEGFALGAGIVMGLMNLGNFMSSLYIGFLTQVTGNSNPRFPIFIGMILTIGITFVWGFVTIRKKLTQISY